MKKMIVAVIGAAVLAGGAYAAVQNAERGPRADADNDGVVTRAEAIAQADERFAAMDADKNGQISTDEGRTGRRDGHHAGRRGQGKHRHGGGLEKMHARPDANGDGLISLDEHRAQAVARFDRTDANKDGRIDAAERDAARAARKAMRGEMAPPPAGAPTGA